MKKTRIMLMITIIFVIMAGIAFGSDVQLQTYYNNYITKKISQCEQTSSIFSNCYNPSMEKLMELRAAQAKFYKTHKTELVSSMLENGVDKESPKMDYFLIKQFKNWEQRHQLATGK